MVHHGRLPVMNQLLPTKERNQLMENWEECIAGCFSVGDREFASHDCDIQRAREMLIAALQQGVGYKEFCMRIKNWLSGQLVNANPHVAKKRLEDEMRKVRKLATYFQT